MMILFGIRGKMRKIDDDKRQSRKPQKKLQAMTEDGQALERYRKEGSAGFGSTAAEEGGGRGRRMVG